MGAAVGLGVVDGVVEPPKEASRSLNGAFMGSSVDPLDCGAADDHCITKYNMQMKVTLNKIRTQNIDVIQYRKKFLNAQE